MAVVNFESTEGMVVDVDTVEGNTLIGCDVPTDPFAIDGTVSFWGDEETIMVLPLSQVRALSFYKEEGERR